MVEVHRARRGGRARSSHALSRSATLPRSPGVRPPGSSSTPPPPRAFRIL